jgi:allene oxide cyclase-like protein
MKRILALVTLALLGAVAASVGLAARGDHGHGPSRGKVIYVIEHATTDAVTNHADGSADSVGDVLTFTNDVFDRGDSTKVGSDQGYCVRMTVGESWECVWTTLLPRGQITVEGPFYDTKNSVLAITGGTGAYSRARGWMELNSRAGGTEFDFIFHLLS